MPMALHEGDLPELTLQQTRQGRGEPGVVPPLCPDLEYHLRLAGYAAERIDLLDGRLKRGLLETVDARLHDRD